MVSQRRFLCLVAAVALCLSLIACTTAAAEGSAPADAAAPPRIGKFGKRNFLPPGTPDPRVVGSAVFKCQDDLSRLCVEPRTAGADGAATPFPRSEVWSCMSSHVDQIQDPDCQTYIKAMVTCKQDAEKIEGCLAEATTEIVSLRRCIRGVKPEQVSKECRESEFFASTQHPRY